jgi:hypothetical protein
MFEEAIHAGMTGHHLGAKDHRRVKAKSVTAVPVIWEIPRVGSVAAVAIQRLESAPSLPPHNQGME